MTSRSACEPLPKPTLSPFALARPGTFLRVGFFTAAVWCVPALRVPLVHSLINHFRKKKPRTKPTHSRSSALRERTLVYVLVSQCPSFTHLAERKSCNGRDAFPSRELSLSGSSRFRSQPPSTRRVGSGKLRSRGRARRVSTHAVSTWLVGGARLRVFGRWL